MPALTDRHIARVCHEANRALQIINREPGVSKHWPAVSRELRESTEQGVAHARAGETPEQLHASWCEHKRATGWTYGQDKSEYAKTHPCLVPYADLPESQRIKDRLFSAIVGALAEPEAAA